jgi:hypothetical protein
MLGVALIIAGMVMGAIVAIQTGKEDVERLSKDKEQ